MFYIKLLINYICNRIDKNNSWSIYIKTAKQRYKYFQDNKDNISQVLINNSYIVNKGSGVIKAVGEEAQYLEYVITTNLNIS